MRTKTANNISHRVSTGCVCFESFSTGQPKMTETQKHGQFFFVSCFPLPSPFLVGLKPTGQSEVRYTSYSRSSFVLESQPVLHSSHSYAETIACMHIAHSLPWSDLSMSLQLRRRETPELSPTQLALAQLSSTSSEQQGRNSGFIA